MKSKARGKSDKMVAAMKAKKKPVTYVLYPDEGHGFLRLPNALSCNALGEAFLAQHLGGRLESIRNDLDGSSLQVLEGTELIPSLPEALRARKSTTS